MCISAYYLQNKVSSCNTCFFPYFWSKLQLSMSMRKLFLWQNTCTKFCQIFDELAKKLATKYFELIYFILEWFLWNKFWIYARLVWICVIHGKIVVKLSKIRILYEIKRVAMVMDDLTECEFETMRVICRKLGSWLCFFLYGYA